MFRLYRIEILTKAGWDVRRHLNSVQLAKAVNATKGQPIVEDIRIRPDPLPEAVIEFPDGPFV